jgi:hypothetical protein
MWKSFANCRNTLSYYHFLFLHLLALFRCNGNSKSIWNWFLEPIHHTVCTSIVGIWILWQFHRKSFVVPLFLLLKFTNHYNHTKIVEASAIHVVLKHQKICTRMHNAQGQDRVRESVCTCNKKITLFIYSLTLAFNELPLCILKSSKCANVIQFSTQFSSACNKSCPFPYSFIKISIKIDIGHIWTQWKNANQLQHVGDNMSIILMWFKWVMFILIEIFHVHFDWHTSLCGNIYFENEIL